jgi:protein-S-isoprenylcysteine O-methyltransferase Ste14
MISIAACIIRALWLLIEVPYLRRHEMTAAKNVDRHSGTLWDLANAIEPIGMIIGFTAFGRMQTNTRVVGLIGVVMLISGIAIRWTAIHTLGKFFTPQVVIKQNHQLVRAGLYRYLRHPAYTGALLAHLGLGLSFANWVSLALSSLPFLIAAWYRMRVEEVALSDAFGAEYLDYRRQTKRLIPGIY